MTHSKCSLFTKWQRSKFSKLLRTWHTGDCQVFCLIGSELNSWPVQLENAEIVGAMVAFFFFFLTSVQSKLEKNGCRVVVFPHFTLSSQGFMSMSFNSSLICTEVLFLYSSSFEHHFCLLLFKLCNQDTVGNTWIASNFLSLPFVYWLGDLTKSETWVGWAKTTDTNTPNLLLALAVPWTTQWGAVK